MKFIYTGGGMKRQGLILIAVLMSLLLNCTISFAQSTAITDGLNYLISTQNPDGSWSGTSTRGMFPTTVASIETLSLLGQQNTPIYANAILWVQSQGLEISDNLCDRIYALSVVGMDNDLLISYFDELTGAWGGYSGFNINNLDTLLAVQALRKINYQDQNIISSALFYLTNNQNADGGWGLKQGMDSEVYYTALVLSTLQQFSLTTTLATAINKATSYLIAHQNPDGGFGSGGGSGQGIGTGSTVYETALAIIALINGNTGQGSALPLQNAITYLLATQLPNGSWDDDPYSTSLALTKTIGLSSFTDRQGSL